MSAKETDQDLLNASVESIMETLGRGSAILEIFYDAAGANDKDHNQGIWLAHCLELIMLTAPKLSLDQAADTLGLLVQRASKTGLEKAKEQGLSEDLLKELKETNSNNEQRVRGAIAGLQARSLFVTRKDGPS